jgi:hypothetical protein
LSLSLYCIICTLSHTDVLKSSVYCKLSLTAIPRWADSIDLYQKTISIWSPSVKPDIRPPIKFINFARGAPHAHDTGTHDTQHTTQAHDIRQTQRHAIYTQVNVTRDTHTQHTHECSTAQSIQHRARSSQHIAAHSPHQVHIIHGADFIKEEQRSVTANMAVHGHI